MVCLLQNAEHCGEVRACDFKRRDEAIVGGGRVQSSTDYPGFSRGTWVLVENTEREDIQHERKVPMVTVSRKTKEMQSSSRQIQH